MDHNRLGQRSPRWRSVTSAHIVIGSNILLPNRYPQIVVGTRHVHMQIMRLCSCTDVPVRQPTYARTPGHDHLGRRTLNMSPAGGSPEAEPGRSVSRGEFSEEII